MTGGRVSEGGIGKSVGPTHSETNCAPAPTGAVEGASPPASAHPASPSAQFAALAPRASSSRPPVEPRVGPPRNATLPRSTTTSATTDPGDVLNRALDRGRAWKQMLVAEHGDGADVDPRLRLSPEQKVKVARTVMESAREGLRALSALRIQSRVSGPDAVEHENVLWMMLSAAAASGFAGREAMLDARWQQDLGLQADPAVSAVLRVAWRGEKQDLGEWVGILNELRLYRAAMDDMVQRMRAPETPRKLREKLKSSLPVAVSQQSLCASATQSVRSVLIAIHCDRLAGLAEERGLTDVASRVNELREASRYRGDEVSAAFTALNDAVCDAVLGASGGGVPPEALNRHKALLEEFVDQYDRVGLKLCLDVAASIEMDDAGIEQNDAGEIWRAMLDTADVVAGYKACVLDLCETVPSSSPPRSAMLTAPVGASPAPAASSRLKPKRRKPGKRAAAPSDTAPAPAAPVDLRTPAQRNADALLKRCPVDHATAKRLDADVIAVARTVGKDTSTAEKLLNDARYDAVQVVDYLTVSARDWFGESDRVRQVQASLSERDDGERIAQLTDRLDALQLIEQKLKTFEADALKRDPLPRAIHLSRLLNSGEIASVGAPVRLPSAGDTGESGTLFEIAIRPERLSDGQHAAPWFVHLHTAKPVASQALHTMEFGAFTAVHLKTARQKKLGRNWEDAMRAWGHTEAKVHRAAIGPALLQELFARAKPSSELVTEAATSSIPPARQAGAGTG
jgi:hypothetical protein